MTDPLPTSHERATDHDDATRGDTAVGAVHHGLQLYGVRQSSG